MTKNRNIFIMSILAALSISVIAIANDYNFFQPTPFLPLSTATTADIIAEAKAHNVFQSDLSPIQMPDLPGTGERGHFIGIVHAIVKDKNGFVKKVIESHNTRTVQGINCAEQILFGGLSTGALNTNGTKVCGLFDTTTTPVNTAHFNGFRYIGLINGSSGGSVILNGSDTYTLSKIGGTRASSKDGIIPINVAASEGRPNNGTVAGVTTCSGNPAAGCPSGTYNGLTITSAAINFTNLAAAGTNIRGAVLLNDTGALHTNAPTMFAENSFTSVSLASTDTITITWTITLS